MGHVRADQHFGWLGLHANQSACERVREPWRGAQQPRRREGCRTLMRSADDALIQFPNSILHLGYADREHPAAKQKKSPNLHVRVFAPVSLQPRTSSVMKWGCSFHRQAKPKQLARPGVLLVAEL